MKITEDDVLINDIRYIPYIVECVNNMHDWGICFDANKIEWNVKIMDSVGLATSIHSKDSNKLIITLNQGLISQSDSEIKDTIYHELAHIVVGVNNKHGEKWLNLVSIIREKTGLPMKVTATELTKSYNLLGYKYALFCQKCGAILGRNTLTNDVENPDEYIHNSCGGKLVRIK